MVNLRKRNADIVQFVSIFGILSPTDICGLEGCIGGCDDVLKDFTEINRFGSHNQTTTPDSERCNSKRCKAGGFKAGQFTNEHKRCKAGGFKAGQFTNEHTPVVNPQGFRSTHTQNSRNASDAGQVLCTTRGEPCVSRIANTEAIRGSSPARPTCWRGFHR